MSSPLSIKAYERYKKKDPGLKLGSVDFGSPTFAISAPSRPLRQLAEEEC
jgi:hypothetical protein